MNKTEFLDILYNQLSGRMPEGNVAAHVQYYRNYIEDEQQKGRTETDILNELGDPHTAKELPVIMNMTAPIPPGDMLRNTVLSWIFPHGTVKLLSF